jgi:NodT family efflux transporter outer membrane factor (OMF) lipoprotein
VIKKAYLIFFILVIIYGCSLHKRQPIEPPASMPEAFIEESQVADTVYPKGKWWKQFNDETLNALMDEAFKNNLDITVAFARLEQVQAVTRATKTAQMPFLDVEGDIKRESSPSFLGDYTGNSYQVSLLAGYEVDLWEKYKSQTKAATLETEATYEDIKALYMGLSAQLVELYYLAVEQRAQLSLTDSTIDSFQEALERVELRYRQGLAPALDVYQAQQNLARARAGRPVFEANLAITEHALATLLGRYPDRETAGALTVIPEIPGAFPAGIPSEMLARRPDIQAALLRVKASDELIASAIADRFPSFNLIGSYGKSSAAFVTGDIVGVFWNAILNVAQPVFDGGRLSAEVDRTRAVFKENLALYHKAVLTAFQEVEDALARNRTSEEHIVLLSHQRESSSNALRVSTFRYMEGLSDYLPVLAAQQSLYESESAILAARRQLISDRVQLARALGGEWMDEYIDERFIAEKEEESKR